METNKNELQYLIDLDNNKLNERIWEIEKSIKRFGVYEDDVEKVVKSKKAFFEEKLNDSDLSDKEIRKLERKIRNLERLNYTRWEKNVERMIFDWRKKNVLIIPTHNEKNNPIYSKKVFYENDRVIDGGFDSIFFEVEEMLLGITTIKIFEVNSSLNQRDYRFISDQKKLVKEIVFVYDFETEFWEEIDVKKAMMAKGTEEEKTFESMYKERLEIIKDLRGPFKKIREEYLSLFDKMRTYSTESIRDTAKVPAKKVAFLTKLKNDLEKVKNNHFLTFKLVFKTATTDEIEVLYKEIEKLIKNISDTIIQMNALLSKNGKLIGVEIDSATAGLERFEMNMFLDNYNLVFISGIVAKIQKMFEHSSDVLNENDARGYFNQGKSKGVLYPTLAQLERRSYRNSQGGSDIAIKETMQKRIKIILKRVEEEIQKGKMQRDETVWLNLTKNDLLELVKHSENNFNKRFIDIFGEKTGALSKGQLLNLSFQIEDYFTAAKEDLTEKNKDEILAGLVEKITEISENLSIDATNFEENEDEENIEEILKEREIEEIELLNEILIVGEESKEELPSIEQEFNEEELRKQFKDIDDLM